MTNKLDEALMWFRATLNVTKIRNEDNKQVLEDIYEAARKWQAVEGLLNHDTVGTNWVHVKSGREYKIIGMCRLEHNNTPAYLYVGADKVVWAREMDEFLDGRFERIAAIIGGEDGE